MSSNDQMQNNEDIERAFDVTLKKNEFPTIWTGILWIGAFFGMQILLSFVAVVVAVVITMMQPGVDAEQAMAQLGNLETLALPMIWALVASNAIIITALYFYLRKAGRWSAVHLDKWSVLNIPTTLGLVVLVIALGYAFNYIYSVYIFPDVEMQQALRELFAAIPDTMLNNIVLFLAVVILAPVVEELIFRGLLQNGLMHHMPAWAAILVASLVFAAIHLDPYAFPALAVLGATFGFLYYMTKSMRVSIAAHIFNNALAMYLGG